MDAERECTWMCGTILRLTLPRPARYAHCLTFKARHYGLANYYPTYLLLKRLGAGKHVAVKRPQSVPDMNSIGLVDCDRAAVASLASSMNRGSRQS
jgi:hypothetical protein